VGGPPKRKSKIDLEKLRELAYLGYADREMAERLGCSVSHLRYVRRKLGLKKPRGRKGKVYLIEGSLDGIRYRKTPLYDWLILWRSEAEALLEALACPKHPVYVDLKQELSENMAHVKAWLSSWLREAAKHIAIVEVKPLTGCEP